MKYGMIFVILALIGGCSFDATMPNNKTQDMVNDMLTDTQDADGNNGESEDGAGYNPPLPESDSGPPLVETEPDASDTEDDNNEGVGAPDDAPTNPEIADAETNPPVDAADTDSAESTDTPADSDAGSDVDGGDTAEPQADAPNAYDAETEADSPLPCLPNCAGKECGDDGCDGSCGICSDSQTCNADFVCECVVGCQIPAEPTADAADATDTTVGADADTSMATTADAAPDSATLSDETGGSIAEATIATDTAVDALINAELSADTNLAEVVAEIANVDTATMAETAPNADTAAGAETGEDTVGEPDIFVQPCVAESALCVDGNICTDDWCDTAAGCVHTNNADPCDDGNQCTANDACANSVCAPGQPVVCDDSDSCTNDSCTNGVGCVYEWVCECASGVQCDDLNPCTDDSCASGFCEYAFNSIACDDSNACTSVDKCVSGECLGVALLNCGDDNQCTLDTCDPTNGCQHEPQTGMVCNDDNACTASDLCDEDVCAGTSLTCNDNNPCTDDSCDEQSGCVYTSNNANPCEDGSLCTVNDYCDAGQCQGGQALKCDDSNLCTDDVCQPQKGCVYPANQAGCDDGNSCTVGDICADMACASGTNICECQSNTDCAKADDDNLCNGTVVCDQSAMPFVCITDPGTIITCNADQDTVCFKNTCVPATGDCEMTAVNEGGGCDDGNACTSNDQCVSGSCAGQSIKCDDSNVCTNDSCDPATGCVFTPNNADCDDGSVCTLVDQCDKGQCVGMAEITCDDFNECTLDLCQKTLGCQHSKTALNGQACNNGDACTVNDTCQNGACLAGEQTCECHTTADCAGKEDGNFCNGTLVCDTSQMPHKCVLDSTTIVTCPTDPDTVCLKNTCQQQSGKCEMAAVNEEGACDDGNPCTDADACNNGVCEGTPAPSGTVIFEDNFDDGNLDGWTVETWNICPNCSLCPCDLPLVEVTEEAPFWVKMSPLAGSGRVLLTLPPIFLPKGGAISFLFAGNNCGGTGSTCEVRADGDAIGNVTSYNNCTAQPPTCPNAFSITKEDTTGIVALECAGISVNDPNSGPKPCGAVYLDDFSITCP